MPTKKKQKIEEGSQQEATPPSGPEPVGEADVLALPVVEETQAEGEDDPLLAFARQFNEDPRQFVKRPDFLTVLELSEKGFLAHLTIEFPRFCTDVTPEELGIKFTKTAHKLLRKYVHLGKRDLLPEDLRKELRAVEMNARDCLKRYSVPTPWSAIGFFIPATRAEEWKEANAQHEEKYWKLRNRIIDSFDDIIATVMRDYRRLAIEAWESLMVRSAFVNLVAEGEDEKEGEEARPEEEEFRGTLPANDQEYETVFQELRQTRAPDVREEFIEKYMERIRAVMARKKLLNKKDVAAAFNYEITRFYIPLSSTLRRYKEERDIENAKYEARLDIIERQRDEELRSIAEMQRAEREAYYDRLRLEEQERHLKVQREQEQLAAERELRAQKKEVADAEYRMQQDMIREAKATGVTMLRQFHDDVMSHIHELTFRVCDEILASIHGNGGRMTGSTSMRLKNLVHELEALNFVQDETVAEHIAKLQAAVNAPRLEFEAKDGTPYTRVDTNLVSRVIDEILGEADDALSELGHMPERRSPRYVLDAFEGEENDSADVLPLPSRLGRYGVLSLEDYEGESGEVPVAVREIRETGSDGKGRRKKKVAAS